MKKKLIFLLIIFILSGCSSITKIDTNNVYDLNFIGGNTRGEIEAKPSIEKIKDKNKKLENFIQKKAKKDSDYPGKVIDFLEALEFNIEPNSGLSEGDKIEISLNYDEDRAKELGLKIKFKKEVFIIKEDSFDKINYITKEDLEKNYRVLAEGIYPDIELSIEIEEDFKETSGINVDIIEIDIDKKFAELKFSTDYENIHIDEEFIILPIKNTSHHIENIKEIESEDLKVILYEAQKNIEKYLEDAKETGYNRVFESALSKGKSFEKPELFKVYFQKLKFGNLNDFKGNSLILIYKTIINEKDRQKDVDLYIPIAMKNIYLIDKDEEKKLKFDEFNIVNQMIEKEDPYYFEKNELKENLDRYEYQYMDIEDFFDLIVD